MNVDKERFICPICFLIPESKVYQCQNGHIICQKCSSTLHQCPQCRVSLRGNKKSRNRFMEDLIDDLTIECSFSHRGCSKQVKRKELAKHESSCNYGKTVTLCQLLYLNTCDFKVHIGNLQQIVSHMKMKHGKQALFTVTPGGILKWRLLKLFDCKGASIFSNPIQFTKPRDNLLFVAKVADDFVSWMFFDLSKAGNVTKTGSSLPKAHQVVEVTSDQTPTVSWKLPIFPILEAETKQHFLEPFNKIHLPSLKSLSILLPGTEKSDYTLTFK